MGLVRSDFFETVNDEAWQNMGNELVVFTHYYVQEEGRAYWVTAAAAPPVIESEPIKPVAHSYREAGPMIMKPGRPCSVIFKKVLRRAK